MAVGGWLGDIRYGLRTLQRNPGFTVLAMLILGAGIGVNTTLFTGLNALILKPLPVSDPEAVFRFERWFASGMRGNVQYAFSYPEYVWLRDHNRSFGSLVAAAWPVNAYAEWSGAAAARIQVQMVSGNYFQAMGVAPRTGRGFSTGDEAPGAVPVVVLSYPYWHRLGGGEVIGQKVKLNGTVFTVAGVMPQEFLGTSQSMAVPECWALLQQQAALAPGSDWLHDPDRISLQILGRLSGGAQRLTAQAENALLIRQFGATHRERDKTSDLTLQRTAFLDNTEDPRLQALIAGIMLLFGTVLLVACANIANMMLARGAARHKELGIRLALGAGRRRVIRQLLTESMLVGLLGGVAGIGMAVWSNRLLWLWVGKTLAGKWDSSFQLALDPAPDGRVMAYALGLALFSGLLFGLSPALRFTRPDLFTALKEESGFFGGQMGRSRMRSILMAAQVSVSVMLLITAGLLTRGLTRSRAADPGFDMRTLYSVTADFGNEKAAIVQRRLLDRLRAVPQVAHATLGGEPMTGTWTPPIVTNEQRGRTLASYAGEGYMETLGIPILQGRSFTPLEVANNAPVAVVSEAAAIRFWGGANPLGRRFRLDMDFRGTMKEFEVIGIAKDVRYSNLTRPDPAHVYVTPKPGDYQPLLLRTQGDPRAALAAIRAAVQQSEPDLMPSLDLKSVEERGAWLQKMMAETMAVSAALLAGLTLLLAGAGIYGVMAYLVTQRTKEIGIRMALGAASGQVVRNVVIAGLRPVFVGMVLGIAGAAAISSVLHATLQFPGSADFLYGVSFYDPISFGGLTLFVLGIAAMASAVPARRAVKVDPLVALRYE